MRENERKTKWKTKRERERDKGENKTEGVCTVGKFFSQVWKSVESEE